MSQPIAPQPPARRIGPIGLAPRASLRRALASIAGGVFLAALHAGARAHPSEPGAGESGGDPSSRDIEVLADTAKGGPAAPADRPRFDVEALERQGVKIGSIRIKIVEIFDPSIPAENRAAYRLVNRLHIETREQTIRNQLTMREGDLVRKFRLAESEVNLRALPFLQDASVEVESVTDGRADILVTTQDSWTTRVGLRLRRSGGVNTGALNLSELNLLGRGKRIDLNYIKDFDRTRTSWVYSDPGLFGSHQRLQAVYETLSDGYGRGLTWERPFDSLDTRLSYGVSLLKLKDEFPLYSGGEVIEQFDHDLRERIGWIGWSKGAIGNSVSRWRGGYIYSGKSYEPLEPLPSNYPDDDVPRTRTISGPTLIYERLRQDFIKVRYFERFSRYEDYNLGRSYRVELGLSFREFGATDNELIYRFNATRGHRTGPDSVVLGRFQLIGRAGGIEEGSGHIDLTHYFTGWPQQTLVVRLSGDHAIHQDAAERFKLGGESGLRGFELRRFEGESRFLINVEDRIRFGREYLRLIRFGIAFFADVGNAWRGTRFEQQTVCSLDPATQVQSCGLADVPVDNTFGNVKADVGVSLLGDAVRAASAGFFRLSVAYPVNGAKYNQPTILVSFGR